MMNKNKIQRKYVSPLDQFLSHFDQTHPQLSLSQQREIAKYRRITRLRDTPSSNETGRALPEDF